MDALTYDKIKSESENFIAECIANGYVSSNNYIFRFIRTKLIDAFMLKNPDIRRPKAEIRIIFNAVLKQIFEPDYAFKPSDLFKPWSYLDNNDKQNKSIVETSKKPKDAQTSNTTTSMKSKEVPISMKSKEVPTSMKSKEVPTSMKSKDDLFIAKLKNGHVDRNDRMDFLSNHIPEVEELNQQKEILVKQKQDELSKLEKVIQQREVEMKELLVKKSNLNAEIKSETELLERSKRLISMLKIINQVNELML